MYKRQVIDGDLVEIVVEVSDADGDELELLLEGGPEGSSLSEGVFTWQTEGSVGVYDLTFTVQEVETPENAVSVTTKLEVFAAEGAIIRNLRAEGNQETVTLMFDLEVIFEGQAYVVASINGDVLNELLLDAALDQSIELDTSTYGLNEVTSYMILLSASVGNIVSEFQVGVEIDNKAPQILNLTDSSTQANTGDRFPVRVSVNDNSQVDMVNVVFEGVSESIFGSVRKASNQGLSLIHI